MAGTLGVRDGTRSKREIAMEPTLEEQEQRPALGIRTTVRIQEIGDRVSELLPRLMGVAGPHCAGPVLARWWRWDGDRGEMELAVPVREPLAGAGDVKPSVLPGGRAVVVWHVGSYDRLKDTWAALGAWLASSEHASRDAPWEEYVDDCRTTPEAELRTRIVWPVA